MLSISTTSPHVLWCDEPLVLQSDHHDLRARISTDPEGLRKKAALYAREQGHDPDEYTPADELVFAVALLDSTWPWADFVIGPSDPASQQTRRVYFTGKVKPVPTTAPPPSLVETRNGVNKVTGEVKVMLKGKAIICWVLHDSPDPVCDQVRRARNRRGEVDALRKDAHRGHSGYPIERRQ